MGALARGQLALDVLQKRIKSSGIEFLEIRYELIGVNAIHGESLSYGHDPYEVRVRVAARSKAQKDVELLVNEVEAMYLNGPSGGGGATKSIREVISAQSVLIPRHLIKTSVSIVEL